MLTKTAIDIATAELVIQAGARCAAEMGVPQNLAVVDDAGHLVAFRRMDGAKFFSIEIAMAKAFTAAGARKATKDIAPATQPGEGGFGAQNLHTGRFTTLGGGIPLVDGNGAVIGAVGVSSGSVAEDQVVAEAAAAFFNEYVSRPSSDRVSASGN